MSEKTIGGEPRELTEAQRDQMRGRGIRQGIGKPGAAALDSQPSPYSDTRPAVAKMADNGELHALALAVEAALKIPVSYEWDWGDDPRKAGLPPQKGEGTWYPEWGTVLCADGVDRPISRFLEIKRLP